MIQPWKIGLLGWALASSCSDQAAAGTTRGAFLVTVINAEIESKKPGGDTWDDPSSGDALGGLIVGGIALYATGSGELASLAGRAAAESGVGGSEVAPDPFVRFSLGSTRLGTDIQLDTCLPNWQTPIVLRPGTADMVTVTIIDADASPDRMSFADDPMGTITLPVAELFQPGIRKLDRFGAVRQLVLRVEPYSLKPKESSLHVRGDVAWTDAAMDVIVGQILRITAKGTIQVTDGANVGPEGASNGRWASYSVLSDEPHGGLLVRIGDGRPQFVGASAELLATAGGRLRFGPNDGDLWNNGGAFDVTLGVR